VTTDMKDFNLIVPCGISDHAVTSLEREVENPEVLPALEEIAHIAARKFGQVFGEQVVEMESLNALRKQMAVVLPQFQAEDTPLRIPAEVERLKGGGEGPVRV